MSASNGGAESLVRGYGGRLLLGISVGWAAVQGGRLLLSPLLPAIRTDLVISNAEAGFAFTLLWGLYALLQYPSGRLSDRLSRKTLLVPGLAVTVLGFGLLATATGYPALLVGATVVGLGAGLYPTAARALLSDLYQSRRGQAFGLHTASGDTGGIVAAGLATLVLLLATWRVAFLAPIVVLSVVALGVHVWSRESYAVERVGLAIRPTARRLVAEPGLRWLLVAYTLYALTWQAATAFLPTFLRAAKALSPGVANAGFGALFLVGAVVKPVAGLLGDRYGRERVAPLAILLGAASLAGLLLADTVLLVALGVVGFAAGLMSFPPVMQAALMDRFPEGSMGGDLGGMRTIYIGLGSLGPTLVGLVADTVSITVAFGALVVGLLACAAIVLAS